MKVAITGKGGVGKSSIAGLISRIFQESSFKVTAIDADPDMNLATILGVPESQQITPIIQLKELIAERTETKVNEPAPVFKMNPKVNDIPEKYSVVQNGIRLMVLGAIRTGGGGCACPENAFLKQLLSHLILLEKDVVILDMEAGIEHLGRGTALGVDVMLVVVEPNETSIETAHRIKKLSGEIGVKSLKVIGNKIEDEEDKAFIQEHLPDLEVAGFVGYSDELRKVSRRKLSVFELSDEVLSQVKGIVEGLKAPAA